MGAWLEEKVSRVKLRKLNENSIGTLEALEFLQLGIHGKWALWEALTVIAEKDSRLHGIDFQFLSARAEDQESQVDCWRLKIAEATFQGKR